MNFCRFLLKLNGKLKSLAHRLFAEPVIKGSLAFCGKGVRIGQNCSFSGVENISVGDNSSLGGSTRILTTRAKVLIGKQVMFGPGVTIVTGDHRTDVIGKYVAAFLGRAGYGNKSQVTMQTLAEAGFL